MKPRITLVLFLIFLGGNVLSQTAVDYMSQMSAEYDKISTDTWDYTSAVAHDKSARKIEKRRVELLTSIKNAKRKISQMKPFNGSTRLRDSVLVFLEINYNVINEDYAKIVDMEAVAEQSYDAMEAYLLTQDLASQKLSEAGDMLTVEQKQFAADNNVNLVNVETRLDNKMKEAGKVFDYHRPVYLIFFKSYIQEKYLLDAMSAGDVSGMEQAREAMKQYSEEGLVQLKEMESFKDDASLKEAGASILKFYLDEAEKVTIFTDFYLKQENFEKIKSAFEAKKEKDRTQKDVDAFNNAVNEYNEAIEAFNSTNETLNKERSKQIDNYNKTSSKFLNRHTPRGKG